jgi:hypothetical protein
MKKSNDFVRCPICKKIYGTMVGTQPKGGKMKDRIEHFTLPSFPIGTNTIAICYEFHRGTQGLEHPHPGQ